MTEQHASTCGSVSSALKRAKYTSLQGDAGVETLRSAWIWIALLFRCCGCQTCQTHFLLFYLFFFSRCVALWWNSFTLRLNRMFEDNAAASFSRSHTQTERSGCSERPEASVAKSDHNQLFLAALRVLAWRRDSSMVDRATQERHLAPCPEG